MLPFGLFGELVDLVAIGAVYGWRAGDHFNIVGRDGITAVGALEFIQFYIRWKVNIEGNVLGALAAIRGSGA